MGVTGWGDSGVGGDWVDNGGHWGGGVTGWAVPGRGATGGEARPRSLPPAPFPALLFPLLFLFPPPLPPPLPPSPPTSARRRKSRRAPRRRHRGAPAGRPHAAAMIRTGGSGLVAAAVRAWARGRAGAAGVRTGTGNRGPGVVTAGGGRGERRLEAHGCPPAGLVRAHRAPRGSRAPQG